MHNYTIDGVDYLTERWNPVRARYAPPIPLLRMFFTNATTFEG